MSLYYFDCPEQNDPASLGFGVVYPNFYGDLLEPYREDLDRILQRRFAPSKLLFIGPIHLEDQILASVDNAIESLHDRLSIVTHISTALYGANGSISNGPIVQRANGAPWDISDTKIQNILNVGISMLITNTGTVLKAPPGQQFRKPSGSLHQNFIRAGNMLKEPSSLAILFHLLVRLLPREITALYIDSFTILSIALTYQRERKALFRYLNDPFENVRLINFHTYSIEKEMQFPVDQTYAILISASTSGNLAKRLIERHSARPESIYHLLYFSSTEIPRCAYFQVDAKRASYGSERRKEINIPGEEFMASYGEIQAVNISTTHISEIYRRVFTEEFYQGSLKLSLQPTYSGVKIFEIESTRTGPKEFSSWLTNEITHTLPSNIAYIVCADDKRSALLAKRVRDRLVATYSLKPTVISARRLEALSVPKGISKTILIVCAEETGGDNLLAISRALRSYTGWHRHYLTMHLFCETRSDLARLKSNLTTTGSNRRYGWSVFLAVAVGQLDLHDSWLLELGRLSPVGAENIESSKSGIGKVVVERRTQLAGPKMDGEDLFLPSIGGAKLMLRKDSVFFQDGYTHISQVVVYLMISGALQRARDGVGDSGEALESRHVLQSSVFSSTVLDPDVFSRYNDGVIQAAILRAASFSEFNYARNVQLSRYARDIIISIFGRYNDEAGEASLEFLLALSTGKLQLTPTHRKDVLEVVESIDELREAYQILNPDKVF